MNNYFHFAIGFAIACVVVETAGAQPYSIDWHKIAGGGGTGSGGNYSLSGTIGQHDAGNAKTSGQYSLTGGFWSLVSVMQTTGAPKLFISSSNSMVIVFWQNIEGWSLQQNSNIANTGDWSLNNSWTTSNGTNYLNVTNPTGNLFYRLKQ